MGVTVQIKGTSTGTVTDIDGGFILSNIPSNATLEISYIGMVTQTILVKGRSSCRRLWCQKKKISPLRLVLLKMRRYSQ